MRLRLLTLCAVTVGALSALALSAPAVAAQGPESTSFNGGPISATDGTPVSLDADVYVPDRTPAPAVILAHGFGGSKQSVSEQAAALQSAGYLVVAYTARGFGASGGSISMNAPEFEIADAQRIIDALAIREDVQLDATSDPKVGVAGASYGGALALMLAGYDRRVDAVVSDITWNDLSTSLFGQSLLEPDPPTGVFKRLWTSAFFARGLQSATTDVTECGRFAPDWCAAYLNAATTGTLDASTRELMRASSPISVTNRITAPTLVMGGQADSLFPLAQTNANAEQIISANPSTPVAVVWHGAGHDGGIDETDRLLDITTEWFDVYLAGAPRTLPDFTATLSGGSVSTENSGNAPVTLESPTYPGISGTSSTTIPIGGPPQQVRAPAGGTPAIVTTLPGIGSAFSSALGTLDQGQSATFSSEQFSQAVTITGAPTIRLRVASRTPVKDVALFASLQVQTTTGRTVLPQGLVSPIRLDAVGPEPTEIDVQLPVLVTAVDPGERVSIVVSTTDFAYQLPNDPAIYDIELASADVSLPFVSATSVTGAGTLVAWVIATVAVLVAVGIIGFATRRRATPDIDPDLVETPLVVRDVCKQFGKSVTAVDHASFGVPKGVVLGLLGPNGAGKTTTMRMVMGLIRPDAGEVRVFGERVEPGAPVLARVGSLVEGTGFLPHLSGRENLRLYWQASGRSGDDPDLEELLEIADLGTAIDRKVKTYSQGMRQRLGIVQAMLGMPELLMLDEPTNGLDPPQIKAMREVLKRYAASGRTVIVSSHLLAEVESTCSHVVVMNRGRVVATGTVAELLHETAGAHLEDFFMGLIGEDRTIGRPT